MNRAVKIRIYPNKEQRVQIEKTIGCSRFIYKPDACGQDQLLSERKKMLRNTIADIRRNILAEGV